MSCTDSCTAVRKPMSLCKLTVIQVLLYSYHRDVLILVQCPVRPPKILKCTRYSKYIAKTSRIPATCRPKGDVVVKRGKWHEFRWLRFFPSRSSQGIQLVLDDTQQYSSTKEDTVFCSTGARVKRHRRYHRHHTAHTPVDGGYPAELEGKRRSHILTSS